ncbi:MAG: hypothetical protein ACOYXU_10175 [Nitrospirota bacterium]
MNRLMRLGQLFAAVLLCVAAPSLGRAEPIRYSVGVKAWASDWVAVNPQGEFRSYLGMMYGPVAIARYKRAFVGATYFTGTLSFPYTQVFISLPTVTVDNTPISATRTDLDLTAGYYLTPTFGLVAGYKQVTYDYLIPAPTNTGGSATRIEHTSSGPFLGALGSYALGRTRFALYGNVTYSFLQRDTGTATSSFGGPSGEVGVAYRFPTRPIMITEAYKYQRFTDSAGDNSDTFQGVIFSVTYSF